MGTKSFDNYADLITFSRASSATYLDSDGLLKTATTNTPRIEYDANGNRLGLLIEEQRTNLLTYSEEFDNADWNVFATLTANQATAPDGNDSAYKMAEDAAYYIEQRPSVTLGQTYTVSIFCKAVESTTPQIFMTGTSFPNTRAIFDLSSGTITSNTAENATITEYPNGWYKLSVTETATATDSTSRIRFFAGGTYIWGAQGEAGAFPTSYIPTSGSTATRAADVASIPVSDFGYNQSEGTVVCEVSHFATGAVSAHAAFGFDDGSSNNRMWYYQNKGQWIGSVSGSTTFSVDAIDPSENSATKVGTTYKVNDMTLCVDGTIKGTDTSSAVPIVNVLGVGKVGASGTQLNGHIKSIKYYPRRLTNDQLVEITS